MPSQPIASRIPAPTAIPARQPARAPARSTSAPSLTQRATPVCSWMSGTRRQATGASTMPPMETSSGISKQAKSTKVATISPETITSRTRSRSQRSAGVSQATSSHTPAVSSSTIG